MEYQRDKMVSPAFSETVTEWLDYAFKSYKDTTAIEFGHQKMTYEELNTLSNKITNYLIAQGVKQGDRIGICLKRSPEMIASIIGILNAGAAYVPLDANYPIERLSMMSEDARLKLLLIHQEFKDRFIDKLNDIICWETVEEEIKDHSDCIDSSKVSGEDLAYVIFTSGSTGRPKGIKMPHRALTNLIAWQLDQYYFKSKAKVLQYSSISFDVSFQEIATTFASGGTLVLINDTDRRDPRILLEFLNGFEIERLFIPFVALRSLIEVAITTNKYPESLVELITAGEQLRVDSGLRQFFKKLNGAILDNQYGPSETHVISAYLLDGNPDKWPNLPPIGQPLMNNNIYILDENMELLEKEEQGELYLAGKNLAHGYIGRDDLTEKVFIKNPIDVLDHPVLYKTGDLGYYNEQGNIEFIGRADHQIKIRGHRVEPKEIDTIGVTYLGISQCITHGVQDHRNRIQLVTYYVAKNGFEINSREFKEYLAYHLPEYMVPAFVIELNEIPYTPSGKIDLKSLPAPEINDVDSSRIVECETETETQLAEIWSRVLGYNKVSRTDNYFDLGGDSLNAVTLFMRIEQEFGQNLPLATLTQASTVKELAKVIDKAIGKQNLNGFRSLQVIQSGDPQKTPLFLIHGGAGNVLIFNDLIKGLSPEQPVYAFQWPGWDGYKSESNINELADLYKSELRKVRPDGPYRIGGYCIGGVIAIEIAKLLKAEGAEVLDPILVVDAPNLYADSYRPNDPESSKAEKQTFEKLKMNLESMMPSDLKESEIQKANDKRKNKNHTMRRYPLLAKYLPFYLTLGKICLWMMAQLQLFRIWLYPLISVKLPIGDRKLYCQLSQISAIQKHEYTPYDGDTLYLKSAALHGKSLSLPGWWDDPFFGFAEMCTGQFDAHVIGGTHNDVLQSERAHKIIKEKMLNV